MNLRPITIPGVLPVGSSLSQVTPQRRAPAAPTEQEFEAFRSLLARTYHVADTPFAEGLAAAGCEADISKVIARLTYSSDFPSYADQDVDRVVLIMTSPYFRYGAHFIPLMKKVERLADLRSLPEIAKAAGRVLGERVDIKNEKDFDRVLSVLKKLDSISIGQGRASDHFEVGKKRRIFNSWGELKMATFSALGSKPSGFYNYSRLIHEMRSCGTDNGLRAQAFSLMNHSVPYSKYRVQKYREEWDRILQHVGDEQLIIASEFFFQNLSRHYPEKNDYLFNGPDPFKSHFLSAVKVIALRAMSQSLTPELGCLVGDLVNNFVEHFFCSIPGDFPALETIQSFFEAACHFYGVYASRSLDGNEDKVWGYFSPPNHSRIGSNVEHQNVDHIGATANNLNGVCKLFPARAGSVMAREGVYAARFSTSGPYSYELRLERGQNNYEQCTGLQLGIAYKPSRQSPDDDNRIFFGRVGIHLNKDTLEIVSLQGFSSSLLEDQEILRVKREFDQFYGDGNVIDTLLMAAIDLARRWGFKKVAVISDQANWAFCDAVATNPKRRGTSLYNLTRKRFGFKEVDDSDYAVLSLDEIVSSDDNDAWIEYRQKVFARDPKARPQEWDGVAPQSDSPSELSYHRLSSVLENLRYSGPDGNSYESVFDPWNATLFSNRGLSFQERVVVPGPVSFLQDLARRVIETFF